jgi:Mn2+/Fe2+ NRAMP family transporter
MGAYRNKRWQNAVAWLTAVIMIVISTVMVFTIVTGQT